eukprot:352856-Chlamydomonas_euryale.AAC.6
MATFMGHTLSRHSQHSQLRWCGVAPLSNRSASRHVSSLRDLCSQKCHAADSLQVSLRKPGVRMEELDGSACMHMHGTNQPPLWLLSGGGGRSYGVATFREMGSFV